MKQICLLFILLLGLGYSFCMAQKVQSQKAFDKMLAKMYENSVPLVHANNLEAEDLANYVILDTREWSEYNVSHIAGAQWAGYDNFQSYILNNIPKDQPILVYCSVGYRSERMGEKIQKMGYQDVKNLYGGIFDWVNQDREVVDANEKVTTKVHAFNQEWGQWLRKGKKVY